MKPRILAVDDEEDLLELVAYNLSREGFDVLPAATGEEALRIAVNEQPDLILLDWMLPGITGLDLTKRLKSDSRTERIPIVMLTVKNSDLDIALGLELGADDYITKPFSPRVLAARVRAVLRRGRPPSDQEVEIKLDDLVIRPGQHEILCYGRPIELTITEFRLLYLLASKPGWVFTRNQIIDAVRGIDYAVTDRSVDAHIATLRKKLGTCAGLVETIRGVGYRFKTAEPS
jgi:two-component system alkaline phosphatase synthesis response regulator PhoP